MAERQSNRIKEIAQRLGFRALDSEARARLKRNQLNVRSDFVPTSTVASIQTVSSFLIFNHVPTGSRTRQPHRFPIRRGTRYNKGRR